MFLNSSCKICKIIRLFLIAVFLLILLALLQKDKLHYLKFINPENASILVLVIGFIIFVGKVIIYYNDKNKNN